MPVSIDVSACSKILLHYICLYTASRAQMQRVSCLQAAACLCLVQCVRLAGFDKEEAAHLLWSLQPKTSRGSDMRRGATW